MTIHWPLDKSFGNSPKIVKYLHDSNADHPVYERENIIHGNCECCTSIKDSERFGEEYRQKIQELHKGRNQRRRLAKITRLQQQQEQEGDNWHPLGIPEEEL